MKIRNSVALVTGANRGIGRELVKALLAHGAQKVYAAAREVSSLEAIVALDPKRVVPIRLDVTQSAQIADAAQIAGDVTFLFNNAGALNFGNILEVPIEDVTRQFAINFYGKLQMARAFAPALERNRGGIVNVLTLVAFASMPGLATYNASKAAAWSMTQSLRATLAAKHVQVFGVFPGAVDTDMLAGVEMPKTLPADVAAAVLEGIESDQEDIFPDAMSTQLYAAWKQDHKAVERQFATM